MDFPQCRLLLAEKDAKNTFVYLDGREPYLKVIFTTQDKVDYKSHSDGDIMPDPFVQQMLFIPECDTEVAVEFTPRDGAVMRRGRALEGQGILSQEGKPLIYGVNGIYDFDSDMLVSWLGFDWHYEGDGVVKKGDRDFIRIRGKVKAKQALIINLYLQYYRKHLGFEFHNPRQRRYNKAQICGWATWEAFHRDINPENIQKSADFLAKTLKPYGLDYIQIDDGYQSTEMPAPGVSSFKEGWLRLNEKFPGGHESIVSAISSKGFKPALWTNAAINNEKYAAESGKCIQGKDGKPLKGPWIGYVYDCTEESVKEICELYHELSAKGYVYFKIDAIRHLIYDGLMLAVREGILSNDEAITRFRNFMQALRKGIGDKYLLSCWGVLSINVGIVDALRFSTDAAARNESLLMQVDESARWHFTHGVLYCNDPDYICLRMENPQARVSAGLASLNGYLYLLSDDTDLYTEDKLDIARKTLPATHAIAAETGPVNYDTPMNYYAHMVDMHDTVPALGSGCLWVTHFLQEGRKWAVVQILRPSGTVYAKGYTINLENLGLDPSLTYEAFDFWEQKPLGRVEKQFTPEAPQAFGGRIIALTPVYNKIEFIASSRHISMDSISVKALKRNDGALSLSLEGIPGKSFDYWFAVPDGSTAFCSGGTLVKKQTGSYLKITVTFSAKEAELTIK